MVAGMKADLVDHVRETLARAGYLATAVEGAGCFDLAGRRDGHLVLVKVLQNVDALAEDAARELTALAATLGATPLLVGLRSSARDLEDGAVYLRHGVRIVTPTTLAEHLLEGTPPLVHAAPGGFYVRIDGARLRELRERRGLSLGDLATAAGVSRRAIGMYEDGMNTMADVAFRLEEFLEESLVEPVDPFAPPERAEKDLARPAVERDTDVPRARRIEGGAPARDTNVPRARRIEGGAPGLDVDLTQVADAFEREVLSTLTRLGFHVTPTRRAPFQGIAKGDGPRDTLLTGVAPVASIERRAELLARIAEVIEAHGTFVVERRERRTQIGGTAVLDREDLVDAEEAGALVDLVEERRRKAR